MNTIGIDQSSFARNCDDQQNLKDIIDAAILSTPEGVTDNIPNVHMISTPVKKPSARNSLCLFTNILDNKPHSPGLLFNIYV